MKKKEKKKKFKVKIIIPIIVVMLVIIGVVSFILYNNYTKTMIKKLNTKFSENVIINKDTKLYDKKYKVVGSISKGFSLKIKKIKVKSLNNAYYPIFDSDYYVYYKDIDKNKNKENNNININNNILIFNQNIQDNNITFYQDKKKVLTIKNNLSLPILYMDSDSYYVSYLDKLLRVKKDKKIKIVEKENTKDNEASYVSVLYYETILPTCTNQECVPVITARENITKLLEGGYHFISKEDYINYLDGNVRLKEKALVLSTKEINGEVKKIADEFKVEFIVFSEKDGINFVSSNKKSVKGDDKNNINRYQLKSYSNTLNVLRMANGEEVQETEPVYSSRKEGVPVLNYHFFYDPTTGEGCNESICLTVQKFREHLEYLKNNGYTALTMKEFTSWIYGEIDVPEKSVLITIDDGAMGTGAHNGNKLIPLLEEYKMHATLFLIAGWWKIDNYKSDYLEIQSHTYNMHQYGSCGKGELVCANYEEAKKDLETSLIEIKDNTSFCYPFYSYDDEAIQAIKDLGFKVAFAGGNRNATRNSDKYIIPRYPILSDITLNRFKEIVG